MDFVELNMASWAMDDISLSIELSHEDVDSDEEDELDERFTNDWQEESLGVTNEQIYNAASLLELCLRSVVTDARLVEYATDCVPGKIHSMLFTAAAELVPLYGDDLRRVVSHLVSTWPLSVFHLRDLLPENRLSQILHPVASESSSPSSSLLAMVCCGLLNLTAGAKLRTADFTGISAPTVFQLPLLFIPKEQRTVNNLLSKINEKCDKFGANLSENLDTVLSWKLATMAKQTNVNNFQGQGSIDIRVDSSMDLGDCMAIEEEIIGLSLQETTPFNINIAKLGIYNFDVAQSDTLRWLLNSMNLKAVDKLVLYGRRKAISQIMYVMHQEFKQMTELTKIDMGVAYPTLASFLPGENMPKTEDILARDVQVLSSWSNLTEIYFIGVMLTNKLKYWFGALHSSLQIVNLHACYLSSEDFLYLAQSHHIQTLTELGLDKNKLSGSADALCQLLGNTQRLNIFTAIDTNLSGKEKASIVAALQQSHKLHTLLMYENEDMNTLEDYAEMVELACAIRPLRSLYIFPFNYTPFEKVYRTSVVARCEQILTINKREDLTVGF